MARKTVLNHFFPKNASRYVVSNLEKGGPDCGMVPLTVTFMNAEAAVPPMMQSADLSA